MQAITSADLTWLVTTAGSANPVDAAIHAAMQSGHFGNSSAKAPDSALPAARSHPSFIAAPPHGSNPLAAPVHSDRDAAPRP